MVAKNFEVGDLVWAKMKGYSSWPAKIADASDEPKSATKKMQHYVYFFGTKNHAWILDDNIEPHSEQLVESRSNKKKSTVLQAAIDEIVEESNTLKKSKFVKEKPVVVSSSNVIKKSKPLKKQQAEVAGASTKASQKTDQIKEKSVVDESAESKSPQNTDMLVKKTGVRMKKTPLKSERSLELSDMHSIIGKKRSIEDSFDNSSKSKKSDHISLSYNGSQYLNRNVAVIPPFEDDSVSSQPIVSLPTPKYVERPSTPILDIMRVSDTLLAKEIKATDKKIGFLGLGLIGRGIVKNLINSGHSVTVYNRTPEKCADFVSAGAEHSLTPADVVKSCDITFCCVSDPDAAKVVVFGMNGVLKGLEGSEFKSKGYVEMTSIDPTTSQEIGEAITYKGGRYLEAPVSGSRKLAEEGSLLILGSGDRTLFNDCESCLYAISKSAYYLSCDVGSGSKMNLVLSMLMGTVYATLGEILSLVERSGLSVNNFLEILSLCPLGCPALVEKGKAMANQQFATNTALKHMQKDMKLSLKLGDAYDQPMQLAASANEVYKHARLLNCSDHDVSAVIFGSKQ